MFTLQLDSLAVRNLNVAVLQRSSSCLLNLFVLAGIFYFSCVGLKYVLGSCQLAKSLCAKLRTSYNLQSAARMSGLCIPCLYVYTHQQTCCSNDSDKVELHVLFSSRKSILCATSCCGAMFSLQTGSKQSMCVQNFQHNFQCL